MLQNIFKKTLSIFLCFLILNLIVYGNATTGLKKGVVIGTSCDNTGSIFASVFGIEIAEETVPENSDNSKNRPQISEEEVHSMFLHKLDICFKTPFAANAIKQQEINSHQSTHILEINPPPPKA